MVTKSGNVYACLSGSLKNSDAGLCADFSAINGYIYHSHRLLCLPSYLLQYQSDIQYQVTFKASASVNGFTSNVRL
jgi:hypothetical protein